MTDPTRPLTPTTNAGRMMLAAGLTFHSGRRLADYPETVIAVEQEAAGEAGLRAALAAYQTAHPLWLSDDEDGCPESVALRAALAAPALPEPGERT